MDLGKAMAGLIAIGLGCRKHCASEAIVALVRRALAGCAGVVGAPRLFSLVDKKDEPGLNAAAAMLELDLVFLPREALAAAASRLLTRSAATRRRFGLDSVAEAAALAGAGPEARLLGPRFAANGATCAIAVAGRVDSLPPCGGGLGRGVALNLLLKAQLLSWLVPCDPPPQPSPTRGEGVTAWRAP
jgi:cobalt-precorrin 5A hydrolase